MIVEFAGLPGTGKTTICDVVVAQLRSSGIEIHEPNRRIRNARSGRRRALLRMQLAGRFVIRHPILSLKALYGMKSAGGQAIIANRGLWINFFAKCHSLDVANRMTRSMSDEGVVHATWSLAFQAADQEIAVRVGCSILERLAPRGLTVVVLESSVADVERRLRLDPQRNRLGRLVTATGSTAVERAVEVMSRVIEQLHQVKVPDLRVLRIRNGDESSVERTAAAIVRAVQGSGAFGLGLDAPWADVGYK